MDAIGVVLVVVLEDVILLVQVAVRQVVPVVMGDAQGPVHKCVLVTVLMVVKKHVVAVVNILAGVVALIVI